MPNLIVDIGNTAVKASWSEGITLGKTVRYQGEYVCKFVKSLITNETPEMLLISSVYEISTSDIEEYRKFCKKVVVLDSSHKEIMEKEGYPTYLTYDRVASMVACRHLFSGKACTIFDLGTTLTVDFVDRDGRYEGGNISLGYRTRFRAINRYSRTLPLLSITTDYSFPGNTFEASINSGVISGIMFEIEGYLEKRPDNVVIFTGGDAFYFVNRVKKSIFAVCNLVLMGLALIADKYADEKL